MEGILEQMDKRLNHLEGELSDLRKEMREEMSGLRDEMREEMSGLRGEMREEISALRGEMREFRRALETNFRWTIGILITMWVTIIIAVLLKWRSG